MTCLLAITLEIASGIWKWYELIIFLTTLHLVGIGVTVFYHRYYTHRAFQFTTVGKWTARPLLTAMGMASWLGPPKVWAAIHQRHHQHTDVAADPHGPINSITELGYVGLVLYTPRLFDDDTISKYSQRRDKTSDWFERVICGDLGYFLIGVVIPLTVTTYFGFAIWYMAGVGFAFYATQIVNSIGHSDKLFKGFPGWITGLFARAYCQPHQGKHCGNSLNVRPWIGWLGFSTAGELYHNNHHKFPNSAILGNHWYELDSGWWTIRLMEMAGLVNKVNLPGSKQEQEQEAT
jgi:stearoyl-CoA desaturase (delta-9 desaturase)